jgi:hypothetical protein
MGNSGHDLKFMLQGTRSESIYGSGRACPSIKGFVWNLLLGGGGGGLFTESRFANLIMVGKFAVSLSAYVKVVNY